MGAIRSRLESHEERLWRAAAGAPTAPIDLLIEVPHGATTAAEFDRLYRHLVGPMPKDLAAFYFVNTDVGTPEAARILADRLTRPDAHGPALRCVRVLRCLIPRTFADVNRALDSHDALSDQGWNPAVPDYIHGEADRALLTSLHGEYDEAAHRTHDEVCGGGGFSLILHSYAPRSVAVAVDDDIVAALRRAYSAELRETWPERPAVEAITQTPDGRELADRILIEDAVARYAAAGIRMATNETYRLHPATSGGRHAQRWPGRTLSIELNRALLVPEFIPFVELETDDDAIARLVAPLAQSLRRYLAG